MASVLLSEFKFRELEAGPRRDVARHFAEMAYDLNAELPDGDDKDACLRLLLESRDCAVRSAAHLLRSSRPQG